MTSQPNFADAARAEAERQYWANPNLATTLPGCVGPFTAGAEWGRDQALAQEPTDAEVEAAAKVLWDDGGVLPWDEERESYTALARAALSAARAARRDEEK